MLLSADDGDTLPTVKPTARQPNTMQSHGRYEKQAM